MISLTDKRIEEWFSSIRVYKEQIHKRYLESCTKSAILEHEKFTNLSNGNTVEPSRGVAVTSYQSRSL